MRKTAKVAVENAALSFDRCYDYRIPDRLSDSVFPGSIVLVPFGRGKQRPRIGIVTEVVRAEDPAACLKELFDAAPDSAQLTPELLDLVRYLKEQTFCTYYEAVRTVIPYGAQYTVAAGSTGPCLRRKLQTETARYYRLREEPLPALTEKQNRAAELLRSRKWMKAEDLCREAGIGRSVLATMTKRGALISETFDTVPVPDEGTALPRPQPKNTVVLTEEQERAFESLLQLETDGKPHTALLHGVTGSGKTMVFIRLIEEAVRRGKGCLVLVPEIGLTPQMVQRIRAIFGERVAVQHSALSNTERLQQYREIQNGDSDIVVGTRSAVFAPVRELGLVIIDEEQEKTYQSENAPRYSAIDTARFRCAAGRCLLLLASATPSVEDYYLAAEGRYPLIHLRERYNAMPLPAVRMVDMSGELAAGNAGALSGDLCEEIGKNLGTDQQTILLLNRRGFNTVAACRDCGEVIRCSLCSVPMVYHKKEDRLLCHYCGAAVSPAPKLCPKCGGTLRYSGTGTQRVEEELLSKFPSARVLRLDLDSTRRKESHERLLADFAAGKYDIMIGTQMVAKGLDFPRVSLVGVLGIDSLLYAQSYRAFERVFSMVTQVVGRGGRADMPGRALIQTMDPKNRILELAASQSYEDFFREEIAFRKLHLYPPFCCLCTVLFSGSSEAETLHAADLFCGLLREKAAGRRNMPIRVLGPAPCSLAMLHGRYRFLLTVKCRNDASFRAFLRETQTEYLGRSRSKVAVSIDFYNDIS